MLSKKRAEKKRAADAFVQEQRDFLSKHGKLPTSCRIEIRNNPNIDHVTKNELLGDENILINNVNIRVVRETRNGLQAAVKASAIFIAAFDTTRTRINNNKKRRRVSPTRARGAGGAGKTRDITEIIKQVSQVFPGCTPSAANQFLAVARCFANVQEECGKLHPQQKSSSICARDAMLRLF